MPGERAGYWATGDRPGDRAAELAVRVEVSPLLNAEGRPGGVIILLHDLSHEKGAVEAAVTGDLSLRLSPTGPRARGQESAHWHQGRGRADGRDVPRRRTRAAVLQRRILGRRQSDCGAGRAGAGSQRAAAAGAGAGQYPHGAASGDADGGAVSAASPRASSCCRG